ncbi:hypothetical protein [Spongiactinospora sp. TRM90649]|uniref:hypothetical protein n=1 Tax=Spongiactinospora sp. TRM90649 TaxID=3031114 RepID=UPI0023F8BAFF|nr:hypothetical protein [Spongiactinospora sp. TRM90649]MDF5756471.1 hypothetical protein [Spongiactinospora sp. TRM90649]
MIVNLAAGAAAVATCVATAPQVSADAPRDLFDSPFFFPSFVVLTVVAGLAAYFATGGGALLGVLTVLPFFILFAARVVTDDQGLWPIGLAILLVCSAFPIGAAWIIGRRS